jgi:hypothetical protein
LYPTKRLIIIPVNGAASLSPGGSLSVDTYCFIEGTPTLSGENIDVVIVAYELQTTTA